MLKHTLISTTLAFGLLAPVAASAATQAITTSDLNIRTGPGTSYQRFDTIPARDRVVVHVELQGGPAAAYIVDPRNGALLGTVEFPPGAGR